MTLDECYSQKRSIQLKMVSTAKNIQTSYQNIEMLERALNKLAMYEEECGTIFSEMKSEGGIQWSGLQYDKHLAMMLKIEAEYVKYRQAIIDEKRKISAVILKQKLALSVQRAAQVSLESQLSSINNMIRIKEAEQYNS